MSKSPDLRGWLPISINRRRDNPIVDWCRLGTRQFTDSFFDDTVKIAMREPFNQLFRHQTPLGTLLDWQHKSPGLEPDGFIFHMSRCGSTLVAQMLGSLPDTIMLSEPPPLDTLLRMDRRGASDNQRIAWLRAWMSAISQARNGERHLYVKLDAWHVFDLPLLRRAFPETPWVFIYRDPVEVMVSALKVAGMHLVPNLIEMNLLFEISPPGEHLPQIEYMVRVLSAIMTTALDHLQSLNGIAVSYQQLPDAVLSEIAPHFGITPDAAGIAAMNAKARLDAKETRQNFVPDVESKQQQASAELRDLCANYLDPLYVQLQALTRSLKDAGSNRSSGGEHA